MCDEQGRFWLANGWGVMESDLPVFRSAQYRRAGMSAWAERVVMMAQWSDSDTVRVDAGRIIAGTY